MTIYSYSRMGTYENCPYQYKLRYIDRISTEEEGVEAFMGLRIHEALETLYADLVLSKMNSVEELLAFYNDQWEKNWHDKILINKEGMSQEDYRKTGEKALRDYYARYHPFDQSKTLWIERMVQFILGGEDYRLRGVIDRLGRTEDGVYEIHDYKGSGRLPTQSDVDRDRQLALYQIAVQRAFPEVDEIELVWHYVLFDTELRSSRTKEQLNELAAQYRGLIDEIEKAEEFPPKESALCDWCGYWEYCPNKKHLVKIEGLPAEERKLEKGYVLVDRFVDLNEKKKQLGEELEEVKEKLFEYARTNDVEIVRGTSKRAKVLIKTEKILPSKSKDEQAYKEIIQLVRNAGVWDQVSTLNTRKLTKDLKYSNLPEELSRELKDFVIEEEIRRISLSKLKEEDIPDE